MSWKLIDGYYYDDKGWRMEEAHYKKYLELNTGEKNTEKLPIFDQKLSDLVIEHTRLVAKLEEINKQLKDNSNARIQLVKDRCNECGHIWQLGCYNNKHARIYRIVTCSRCHTVETLYNDDCGY